MMAEREVMVARGVLAAIGDEWIDLEVPGTDYRLRLETYKAPTTPIGKRIHGIIRARARRIDVVRTGGRYVEPVYGRPRRVQGRVAAIDESDHGIVVQAGVPIVCRLTDDRQRPADFAIGDFVSFDVMAGATFTPTQ